MVTTIPLRFVNLLCIYCLLCLVEQVINISYLVIAPMHPMWSFLILSRLLVQFVCLKETTLKLLLLYHLNSNIDDICSCLNYNSGNCLNSSNENKS